MNHMWWTVVMKWNEMTEWSLLWITQNWSQGKKKKLRTFISSLSLHILACTRFWSTPLIKRFRGFKISQWPLRFCQLLDNMSLVTLVKIITFWPYWTFSKSPTFAESDTFETFWNPWRLPILVITIVNQGVSQNLRIKSCWILNLFSIYFYSILKLKDVARKFNVLPERQAKVNYMIAAREKVEAAKVKVPILQSRNSAQVINCTL